MNSFVTDADKFELEMDEHGTGSFSATYDLEKNEDESE